MVHLRHRLIGLGLLLAFSLCYMEWGGSQSAFVFEAQYQIVAGPGGVLETFSHPIILGAIIGQALLLAYAIRSKPHQLLAWAGVVVLSPVVLLILIGSVMTANVRSFVSVLPFVILTGVLWWSGRTTRRHS